MPKSWLMNQTLARGKLLSYRCCPFQEPKFKSHCPVERDVRTCRTLHFLEMHSGLGQGGGGRKAHGGHGAGEKREKVVASWQPQSNSMPDEATEWKKCRDGYSTSWLLVCSRSVNSPLTSCPFTAETCRPHQALVAGGLWGIQAGTQTQGLVGFRPMSGSKRQICPYLVRNVPMTSAKWTSLQRVSMSIRGPGLHPAAGNGAQANALSPSFLLF